MADDTQLYKIKRRLGIEDNRQDELLEDLLDDAKSQFKVITGADIVDEKYEFITRDVALKLYVRKGSEGTASESVDGYSVTYATQLFDEYLPILERDFNLNSSRQSGKVRFL